MVIKSGEVRSFLPAGRLLVGVCVAFRSQMVVLSTAANNSLASFIPSSQPCFFSGPVLQPLARSRALCVQEVAEFTFKMTALS